ncbi:MAG: nucleotidyltransferase family protein [Peptostreptococcaceae bacterium]|nr:nucleotidyltransferase family protein [Peptostreptococcaceae bacterium]
MERSQEEFLADILKENKVIWEVLEKLSKHTLPDYYIAGGCVVQTVWNHLSGKNINYGIEDIDLVYFDASDLSLAAEDEMIRRFSRSVAPCELRLDIKNQARVHLWYKDKFGYDIEPYHSLEDALHTWETTVTAIGVRLEKGDLKIYAPFGLDDLFHMIFRANKIKITKEIYDKKAKKWKARWPELQVIDW